VAAAIHGSLDERRDALLFLDELLGEDRVFFGLLDVPAEGADLVEEVAPGQVEARVPGGSFEGRDQVVLEGIEGDREGVEGGLAGGRGVRDDALGAGELALLEGADPEGHGVAEALDHHQRQVVAAAAHEVVREGDRELALHLALEGSGAVARVVGALDEGVEELGLDVDEDVAARDAAAAEELAELLVDHHAERLAGRGASKGTTRSMRLKNSGRKKRCAAEVVPGRLGAAAARSPSAATPRARRGWRS
jgi:hypothetical protein